MNCSRAHLADKLKKTASFRTYVRYSWVMALAIATPDRHIRAQSLAHCHAVTPARQLSERTQPAGLELPHQLAPLMDAGVIASGSVFSLRATPGRTSLLLQLLMGATQRGHWCAVVGIPQLGLLAANESGVDLARLAILPHVDSGWLQVLGTLLSAVDFVVLHPPARCSAAQANRFSALARQHSAVLAIYESTNDRARWPTQPDFSFATTSVTWSGLTDGHGALDSYCFTVQAKGRRLPSARQAIVRITRPNLTGTTVG